MNAVIAQKQNWVSEQRALVNLAVEFHKRWAEAKAQLDSLDYYNEIDTSDLEGSSHEGLVQANVQAGVAGLQEIHDTISDQLAAIYPLVGG